MDNITGHTPCSPSISLCMIVKNEEAFLDQCLQSVTNVVSEIIVVDTGSTDRTIEIARKNFARIFNFPWQNDFSLARNYSLSLANSNWILVLDADEELTDEFRTRILPLLSEAQFDAVSSIVRNLQPPDNLVRFSDMRSTRIFRNTPQYRYEQAIHEQIKPSILRNNGKILDCDLVILHYGYAKNIKKDPAVSAKRNLRLLLKMLEKDPSDLYLHYQIGITYIALKQPDIGTVWLKKAIDLSRYIRQPDYEVLEDLHMKTAQQMLRLDEYQSAIESAQKSLEINPGNIISRYVMAVTYMYTQQYHLAIPLFQELLSSGQLSESTQNQVNEILKHYQSKN